MTYQKGMILDLWTLCILKVISIQCPVNSGMHGHARLIFTVCHSRLTMKRNTDIRTTDTKGILPSAVLVSNHQILSLSGAYQLDSYNH